MSKTILDIFNFISGGLLLPAGQIANEGAIRHDQTTRIDSVHDSQRERNIGAIGWQPFAYPLGGGPGDVVTTSQTLAANGGSVAVPFSIDGHFLLQSLTFRSLDTSLQHTAEWRIYAQRMNNGNAAENSLNEVVNANGTFDYTPSAAANQTSTPTSTPTYMGPGLYWLVLRNTSPSNRTLLFGSLAAGTMALNICQTKTLGSALASTLDFVAATWTKATFLAGMRLNGRVFGQTAAF